jgi:hypothetical protein
MTIEKPATGILKHNDYGDSIWYYVPCDCTDLDHAHTIDVEADDHSVTITIYANAKSKFWSKNRWRQIWDILTKGYTEFEVSTILNEQQAINYAAALTSAANDVKVFKDTRDSERKKPNES